MGLQDQQLEDFDMTIATNREALDNGSDSGCRVRGVARQVISPAGTATTLTAGQSGAMCVMNTVGGQTYVLPAIGANDVGMEFDFVVTVTGTGTYSVTTDAATTFIGGGVSMHSTTVAQGGLTAVANPAGTLAIAMDSDITGRLVGGSFKLTAISTTVWSIGGNLAGVGTLATPF